MFLTHQCTMTFLKDMHDARWQEHGRNLQSKAAEFHREIMTSSDVKFESLYCLDILNCKVWLLTQIILSESLKTKDFGTCSGTGLHYSTQSLLCLHLRNAHKHTKGLLGQASPCKSSRSTDLPMSQMLEFVPIQSDVWPCWITTTPWVNNWILVCVHSAVQLQLQARWLCMKRHVWASKIPH